MGEGEGGPRSGEHGYGEGEGDQRSEDGDQTED